MSSTSASPTSITRSPASWCGLAEFGPEATIAKSAASWPASSSSSRMWRLTSASVRPERRSPMIGAHDAVGGRGRAAQALDLLRALDPAQRAHRRSRPRPARWDRARPAAEGRRAPTSGPAPPPAASRRRSPGRAGSGRRSRPTARAELVGQLAELVTGKRLLEARQHERRLAIGRDDQAGQPLERRRSVPEQVGVVRRGGDQQGVHARARPPRRRLATGARGGRSVRIAATAGAPLVMGRRLPPND